MKQTLIILQPSDISDIRDGLRLLTDRVDALHEETHRKRVRKEVQDTLLTLPETCEYLRISRSTAFRWIANGTLTPIKSGRKNVFPLTELEKALIRVNNSGTRGYDYK